MSPHALISGASIAGPLLAHQLNGYGWRTTVLERFPRLRDEGHNIDVRGTGREVLRRIGLEEAVLARRTRERGMRFVDDAGRPVASFPVEASDGEGPTAELEILRGDLSDVFYRASREQTDYRFDRQIEAVDDRGEEVVARLDDGEEISADVLVVAEGLRSRTRGMVLPKADVFEMNMYCAYLTIAKDEADDGWWNWYHAERTRAIHLRPDRDGTTSRALLSFISEVRGLDRLRREDQVQILRQTFADVGWASPRILDQLDDAPFYFEALGQARLPSWSHGRSVVIGDAAHGASPIRGRSTSLAVTGAYLLAGELASREDHREAMLRYERLLRPYVDEVQQFRRPPTAANPRTREGVRRLRRVAGLASSPLASKVGGLGRRLSGGGRPEPIELPHYHPTR